MGSSSSDPTPSPEEVELDPGGDEHGADAHGKVKERQTEIEVCERHAEHVEDEKAGAECERNAQQRSLPRETERDETGGVRNEEPPCRRRAGNNEG